VDTTAESAPEFRDLAAREARALVERLAAAAATQAEASVRDALGQQRGAIAALRVQIEQNAKERRDIAAALEEAQKHADELRGALEAERDRAATAEAEASAAAEQFQATLERLTAEQAGALRQQAIAYATLPLDELLTTFNALSQTSTLSGALSVVVKGLARQFPRVALFNMQGNRLEGVQQLGFDFEQDISRVAIPLTVGSLLTDSVASLKMEALIAAAAADASRLPFGGAPTCAFALPIVVHGEVLAVIYVDDVDRIESSGADPHLLATFATVLWQHALLTLLRISNERKAVAELREYASTLVSDVERWYMATIEAGTTEADCQEYLRGRIESARRLYARRVTPAQAAAAQFLEEQFASVMDARAHTVFGRSLTAVVRGDAPLSANGGRV
jgi:hypothetical protein